MNTKRTSLIAAAAGTVVGVAGMALLAMPAGAGPTPTLPKVSAEQLVQSVLSTKSMPALAGTITDTNNLGLPAIPGLSGEASKLLANGSGSKMRVWSDGHGRDRVSVPDSNSEETLVFDGSTLWDWNSSTNTVTKNSHGIDTGKLPADGMRADPSSVAKQLVGMISKDSTVTVDGTATVAGRSVYELVLAPKPGERTMLREIRIAVDAETKLPLQLGVLANGSATPAFQVGFSELTVGAQDESLFQFTPPAGAKVTDSHKTATRGERKTQQEMPAAAGMKPTVVGEGWDTVIITRAPSVTSSGSSGSPKTNPLLKQLGKPASGAWGSGYVLSTSVGTALITNDGRIAVGAVPLQVLTSALVSAK